MNKIAIIAGLAILGLGTFLMSRGTIKIGSIMQTKLKTSPAGRAKIKQHEGLRLTQYKDAAGFATIGYGHLLQPGEIEQYKTITLVDAERFFNEDLLKAENCVNSHVKVTLTQNQFDALVSFVYNLGCGNFRTSTLLKLINESRFITASAEFIKWNKAGGRVLAGLVTRRESERQLFLA